MDTKSQNYNIAEKYSLSLKEKAVTINNILSEYIKLHNSFMKSTGSFLSIFRHIDFQKLSGEAYFLFEKLRDERKNLEGFKSEPINSEQKGFYDCVCRYLDSLKETVYLLFIMLHALEQKAKGENLNFKEHNENFAKYKVSVNAYMLLGQELNELYKTI